MRLLLLTLLLVPIITVAENNVAFLGSYKCSGYDPYLKQSYTGSVLVTQQKTVYRLNMKYDTGETYDATGGQYDPTLMSVVFQDRENLKRVGLEQYKLADDKLSMQGYWVYLGEDKLGKEVCKRITTIPK